MNISTPYERATAEFHQGHYYQAGSLLLDILCKDPNDIASIYYCAFSWAKYGNENSHNEVTIGKDTFKPLSKAIECYESLKKPFDADTTGLSSENMESLLEELEKLKKKTKKTREELLKNNCKF